MEGSQGIEGSDEHGEQRFAEEKFEDTHPGTEEFDEPGDDSGNNGHYARIDYEVRQRVRTIDKYINTLWSRRVLMSTLINVCLVLSALYSGTVFILAVIFTCFLHIVDKHLDFGIHKLYQAKDYAKNRY